MKKTILASTLIISSLSVSSGSASAVNLRVTFDNLTTNSVFSPVSSIFHDGSFDNFNIGQTASTEIEWIAELGNASFLNTLATDQGFTAQAVGGGPITGGSTVSLVVNNLNPNSNRYFNFASMFIPSNDAFIGNDNPLAYEVFNDNGDFLAQTIEIPAGQIWDSGTEFNNEFSPDAVIPGQPVTPSLDGGITENGFIAIHPGYIDGGNFESLGFLSPDDLDSPVARITISEVSTPEPTSIISFFAIGITGLGFMGRNKRQSDS